MTIAIPANGVYRQTLTVGVATGAMATVWLEQEIGHHPRRTVSHDAARS